MSNGNFEIERKPYDATGNTALRLSIGIRFNRSDTLRETFCALRSPFGQSNEALRSVRSQEKDDFAGICQAMMSIR